MAKEPAGLRRWRLAHRKKKHRVVRTMARRRRVRRSYRGRKRKGGRRGSKSLPVIQTMMIGYPIVKRVQSQGLSTGAAVGSLFDLTGYDADSGKFLDPKRGVGMAIGLLVVSTLGAKIANRSGANRLLKKLSAGMLKFA